MSNMDLFDDDDEGDLGSLKINESYATSYDTWRRKEELQKLKDRYGDDPEYESSSSSDGEFCEPENPKFDREFLKTLAELQTKRDDLKNKRFFCEEYGRKKDKSQEKKEAKPMTIGDYERHVILERGGKYEDDDEEDAKEKKSKMEMSAKEREDIIKSFNKEVDSNDEDDLLSSGLFKVKDSQKTEEEGEKEEDVFKYIKGKKKKLKNKEEEEVFSTLKNKWSDPSLPEKEKWLADFFLNHRYLEEEDERIERAYNQAIIDEETLSEDEKTIRKSNEFDRQYRFRFQEPDQEFIKQYPRNIDNSLRSKDSKRKKARESYEERKKREKEQKRQEIERLKALKYQEIMEKIEKIKEVSGNDDLNLNDEDLEEEFDPEAHDARMANMFGDNYYGVCDEEKPVFSDNEDEYQDYDDLLEKQNVQTLEHEGTADDREENEEEDGYIDYENINMDADYDPSQEEQGRREKSSKRTRKKSKFMQVLDKQKPVFNPEETNFDTYFEEYYNLDFEDLVGGIPCRYRYRKVEPNDFGLSTGEILGASVDELQKWVPLKKILRYDRTHEKEEKDFYRYRKRGRKEELKMKILASLFSENPEKAMLAAEEKKREKNVKKKLRRQKKLIGEEMWGEEMEYNTEINKKHEVDDEGEAPKKKRKKKNVEEGTVDHQMDKKKKKKNKDVEFGVQEEENGFITEKTKKKGVDGNIEANNKIKKKKNVEKNENEEETLEDHENKEPTMEDEDMKENNKTKKKKGGVDENGQKKKKKAGLDENGQKKKKKADQNENGQKKKKAGLDENGQKKKKKADLDGNGQKKKKKRNLDESDLNVESAPNRLKQKKKNKKQHEGNRQPEGWSKKQKKDSGNQNFYGLSDERLTAYGENPRKFKNKIKYGGFTF